MAAGNIKQFYPDELAAPSPRRMTVISVPEIMRVPLRVKNAEEGVRVEEGQEVVRFQLLCVPKDAPPIYSPVCGTVLRIESFTDPAAGKELCAVVEVAQRQKALRGIPPAAEGIPDAERILRIAGSAAVMDELDGTPLCDKLLKFQEQKISCLAVIACGEDFCGSASEAVLCCDTDRKSVV